MKLHLGCGSRVIPGWVGVDLYGSGADLVEDVRFLPSIEDGSCDLIYACHVLDHLARSECVPTLSLWHRKLKPGGILRLAVSNFKKIATCYVADEWPLELLLGLLVGGQKSPYDFHKNAFDEATLRSVLGECCFQNVRWWDWRSTDHADVDDFSQAYLPHMDKECGTLMSLNLEAEKW